MLNTLAFLHGKNILPEGFITNANATETAFTSSKNIGFTLQKKFDRFIAFRVIRDIY